MSDDGVRSVVSSPDLRQKRLRVYRYRVLLAGLAILALSFLVGIVLSFYRWDHGSPWLCLKSARRFATSAAGADIR